MVSRDNSNFLSASTLKGDRVVNRAGEDLGQVEDFMIDLKNGRIAYAVLSFGGFLGMGNRLFAIPWQALKLELYEHAFILDIDREVLENAEGFEKGKWPLTCEELSRVYIYYGYQPYWKKGVLEQTGIPEEISAEKLGSLQ